MSDIQFLMFVGIIAVSVYLFLKPRRETWGKWILVSLIYGVIFSIICGLIILLNWMIVKG